MTKPLQGISSAFDLGSDAAFRASTLRIATALKQTKLRGFLVWLLVTTLLLGTNTDLGAAPLTTQNVFLITTDGLRWQEVFDGAEARLMTKDEGGVKDTNALAKNFWRSTPEARRTALLPFLWGKVAKEGQIWGNHAKGSIVQVTNGRNFSYPGYSEFLTGIADPRIESNDPKPNPNVNVFQWLHTQKQFAGKIGASVSWGVIPWILNSHAAGFPVWSAFAVPEGTKRFNLSPDMQALLERTTPIWSDVSLDSFAGLATKEMVLQLHPRAFYAAFGETDDWCHDGRYDLYLRSAHNFDRFVKELWELVQSIPQYRNQTTFILGTDHGRGPAPLAWKSHGQAIPESGFVWVGILGPDTPALGERQNIATITQSQIAATVAAFFGEDFVAASPKSAKPIPGVVGR